MKTLSVEESNLLSIYNTGCKRELVENLYGALPFMDQEMRTFSERVLLKLENMTETEYTDLPLDFVDE